MHASVYNDINNDNYCESDHFDLVCLRFGKGSLSKTASVKDRPLLLPVEIGLQNELTTLSAPVLL